MRALPVAGGTVREAARDVLLGGKFLIPARTPMFLPLHAIHNTWRNFEQPGAFLPERWAVPGAEYARRGLTPDSTVPGMRAALCLECLQRTAQLGAGRTEPATCRQSQGQCRGVSSMRLCLYDDAGKAKEAGSGAAAAAENSSHLNGTKDDGVAQGASSPRCQPSPHALRPAVHP
jgi:hypothetical protein